MKTAFKLLEKAPLKKRGDGGGRLTVAGSWKKPKGFLSSSGVPYQARDRRSRLTALLQQALNDPLLIKKWTVLTHFPFSDESGDGHFKSSDRSQLLFDIISRRIRHVPGVATATLVSVRKPFDK